MTRVLAILAHPNKDSLNGRFFYSTVQHLQQQGITVDVLDLYQHADRIPFYISQKQLDENDFFKENRELFMAADRLFIVYPVYWYAVPGILKCWIDLITNYAWKYQGDRYAKPLHKIEKALVVNTASMSNWAKWLYTRNSASEMLKETFKWMGIKNYDFYEVGSTSKLTTAKIDAHLAKIAKKSDWLVQ